MSFSDYCENYLLNLLFTNKTLYAGYGSAGSDSAFTEFSGNNYSRKAYGAWTLTSYPGGDQYVTNDAAITFDAATGTQGTASHVGLWDASTGGNLIAVVSFSELGQSDVSVITGTQIQFAATKCKVELD
jgi:hypothetical protein